jgi:uncharacterized protein
MTDKKTVVLYHANCPDGFGAAWSFYKKYGLNAEYIPVSHGAPPPPIDGRDVFIVDFSYSRAIMVEMHRRANSMVVLDHHKSAEKECSDLSFCHFDMNHSGAYLAWQHLFGDKSEAPLLIRYVEDRDLWKWKLPKTEEVLSVVDSFDRTFENWDSLNLKLDQVDSDTWKGLVSVGSGILAYKNSLIKQLLKNSHNINILGESIPAINAPFFQSELASELAMNTSYAAAYYYDGSGYKFSLRSRESGRDVSIIASKFGGGGHAAASGFSVDELTELDKEKSNGKEES